MSFSSKFLALALFVVAQPGFAADSPIPAAATPPAPAAAPGSKGPIEVYLIGGQSNATGQGYVKNFPPGFKPDERVLLFHSGGRSLHGALPSNVWHVLAPASEDPSRFGMEIGFGNRLQELRPDRKIALIKHATSGTNLYTQWNPGPDATDPTKWGPQFKIFADTVDAGLKALRDDGYVPTVKGMLWHQGENDGNRPDTANAYATNLTHFIERVRAQYGTPDMCFVLGTILPQPNYPAPTPPNTEIVRQAQFNLAQNSGSPLAVKGVFTVVTDKMTRRADDPGISPALSHDYLHLSSAANLEMGQLMADEVNAYLVSRESEPPIEHHSP